MPELCNGHFGNVATFRHSILQFDWTQIVIKIFWSPRVGNYLIYSDDHFMGTVQLHIDESAPISSCKYSISGDRWTTKKEILLQHRKMRRFLLFYFQKLHLSTVITFLFKLDVLTAFDQTDINFFIHLRISSSKGFFLY